MHVCILVELRRIEIVEACCFVFCCCMLFYSTTAVELELARFGRFGEITSIKIMYPRTAVLEGVLSGLICGCFACDAWRNDQQRQRGAQRCYHREMKPETSMSQGMNSGFVQFKTRQQAEYARAKLNGKDFVDSVSCLRVVIVWIHHHNSSCHL